MVNKRKATNREGKKIKYQDFRGGRMKRFYVSSTMHEPIKIGSTSLKVHYTHKTKREEKKMCQSNPSNLTRELMFCSATFYSKSEK